MPETRPSKSFEIVSRRGFKELSGMCLGFSRSIMGFQENFRGDPEEFQGVSRHLGSYSKFQGVKQSLRGFLGTEGRFQMDFKGFRGLQGGNDQHIH